MEAVTVVQPPRGWSLVNRGAIGEFWGFAMDFPACSGRLGAGLEEPLLSLGHWSRDASSPLAHDVVWSKPKPLSQPGSWLLCPLGTCSGAELVLKCDRMVELGQSCL